MPDFDLVIMARDNTHDLPPEKESGRWRAGEVVDVFRAGKLDPDNQPECFAIVRVTNYDGTLDDLRAEVSAEGSARRRKFTVAVPEKAISLKTGRMISFTQKAWPDVTLTDSDAVKR